MDDDEYLARAGQWADELNAMLGRKSWRPDMVTALSAAIEANVAVASELRRQQGD